MTAARVSEAAPSLIQPTETCTSARDCTACAHIYVHVHVHVCTQRIPCHGWVCVCARLVSVFVSRFAAQTLCAVFFCGMLVSLLSRLGKMPKRCLAWDDPAAEAHRLAQWPPGPTTTSELFDWAKSNVGAVAPHHDMVCRIQALLARRNIMFSGYSGYASERESARFIVEAMEQAFNWSFASPPLLFDHACDVPPPPTRP